MLGDVRLQLLLLLLQQPHQILQLALLCQLGPDLGHVLLDFLLVEVLLLVVEVVLALELLLLPQQLLDVQSMHSQLIRVNIMIIAKPNRALFHLQPVAPFLHELLLRALRQPAHYAFQVAEVAVFAVQHFRLLLLPAHEAAKGIIKQLLQVLFFDRVKFDVVLLDYILPFE